MHRRVTTTTATAATSTAAVSTTSEQAVVDSSDVDASTLNKAEVSHFANGDSQRMTNPLSSAEKGQGSAQASLPRRRRVRRPTSAGSSTCGQLVRSLLIATGRQSDDTISTISYSSKRREQRRLQRQRNGRPSVEDIKHLAIIALRAMCVMAVITHVVGRFFSTSWLISWISFSSSAGLQHIQIQPATTRAQHKRLPALKPSKYYTIPTSMVHIGDKSDHYAKARKRVDEIIQRQIHDHQQLALGDHNTENDVLVSLLENTIKRIPTQTKLATSEEEVSASDEHQSMYYDIHNCPDVPPEGYPYEWNVRQHLLKEWPLDDANVKPTVHQGICVFDYRVDYEKAANYRHAEVPFIVQNDPQVIETVLRWNSKSDGPDQPNFLEQMLGGANGDDIHRAEYSTNNHFLYWNVQKPPSARSEQRKRKENPKYKIVDRPSNWTNPTEMIKMTYKQWLEKANSTEATSDFYGADMPHWYFRLIGCGEVGVHGECDPSFAPSEYLFDELPFFQPKEIEAMELSPATKHRPSLYIVDPEQQRGIHCRFGMKGVIAENHFDGSRNSIVVLGGARRYILNNPNQCPHLCLHPIGHPSARHSTVDWSHVMDDDPLSAWKQTCPEFDLATGNEVVLQAGDVLYLPTDWFHTIVSLSVNFQCNTRSGKSQNYRPPIAQCGF